MKTTTKTNLKVTAKVTLDNGQVIDAIAVNPGGWFMKPIVIGIAIANAWNPLLVIEADHLQDAIDVLADSEEHGHFINVDPEIEPVDLEVATVAGNDSHVVDLDNVSVIENCKVTYNLEIPLQNGLDSFLAEIDPIIAQYNQS